MEKTSCYLSEAWDSVAKDYDTIKPSAWEIVGNKLINISNISKGNYVLDVGSGKGSTLIPISHKVGANGKVIGIDLSIAMVNFANKLITELNILNIEIFHQDAANITFDNDYFDNIIGNFSFRYLLQNEEIFKRVISKLKPGGTLSFTLWGDNLNDLEIGKIVDKYIVAPIPPIEQLNKSNLPLNTAKDIENYLKIMGLHKIKVTECRQDILYNREEDFIKWLYASLFNITVKKLKSLGDDMFNKFEEDFFNLLSTHRVKDGVLITWNIIYATCEK